MVSISSTTADCRYQNPTLINLGKCGFLFFWYIYYTGFWHDCQELFWINIRNFDVMFGEAKKEESRWTPRKNYVFFTVSLSDWYRSTTRDTIDRWVCLCATLLSVPEMQVSTWHRGVEPFTCSLESFLNIFRCLSPLYIVSATAPNVPTTLTGKPWIAVWVLSRSKRWKSQLKYTLCSSNFLALLDLTLMLTLLDGSCRSYGSSTTRTLNCVVWFTSCFLWL